MTLDDEKAKKMRKTLVTLGIIAIAVIGGVIAANLAKDTTEKATTYADVPVGSASLVLSPATKSVKVGDEITLDVVLNTGSDKTTGSDLSLRYDPALLEVLDNDSQVAGVQITAGTLFDFVPQNTVTLATGLIEFSAAQQPTSQAVVAADGKLATITFKAKAAGTANVRFDFTAGSTSDTNVIQPSDGRDLLNTVEDAQIKITR